MLASANYIIWWCVTAFVLSLICDFINPANRKCVRDAGGGGGGGDSISQLNRIYHFRYEITFVYWHYLCYLFTIRRFVKCFVFASEAFMFQYPWHDDTTLSSSSSYISHITHTHNHDKRPSIEFTLFMRVPKKPNIGHRHRFWLTFLNHIIHWRLHRWNELEMWRT